MLSYKWAYVFYYFLNFVKNYYISIIEIRDK